jgi:hypothetical protein
MRNDPPPNKAEARARFRRTLFRVLAVQVVALALLAALQLRYGL